MSQGPAWFGRKFDFTFPAEQYPNLCVRLRGSPAQLEELFRGVSRDVLLAKAGDNWSAQEHAGHLLDSNRFGWREWMTSSAVEKHSPLRTSAIARLMKWQGSGR